VACWISVIDRIIPHIAVPIPVKRVIGIRYNGVGLNPVVKIRPAIRSQEAVFIGWIS